MGLLIVIVVIVILGYLVSLRLHPWRRCRACQGTGRHFGTVWKSSHRMCTSCGGNGRRARLGINTFHRHGQVWGERMPIKAAEKRSRNFGR
jgi:DnaJ-class molecular chaperone